MKINDNCSYELSKALKAAGFDEPCRHYYDIEDAPDGCYWEGTSLHKKNHNEDITKFSSPTLAHVQKWLREKKGIAINVIAHDDGKYEYDIVFLPKAVKNDDALYRSPWCRTYEEALSEGIDTALELIKKGV